MIYFSKLKTALIAGVCVLGVLLCIPNFLPAPASWLPWRTVHLGLDLRGGSYLLLEVDMAAVTKERLDSLADTTRTALRNKVQFQPPQIQAAQNRVVLRLRDPAQTDTAVNLLQEATKDPSGAAPEYAIAATAGTPGEITISLSETALRARADAAVLQSIEIVRRRIDETGVLDPQIARQ
ncbi:MAG: protein translocase subunit SecD, partial [Alphaproteobacteria bacterium]